MTDAAQLTAGAEIRDRLIGKLAREPESPLAEMRALTHEQVWSGLWARPGLALKERTILTLGLLTAGGHEPEVEHLVRGALCDGLLTAEEIVEVVLHCAGYVGHPTAKHAMAAAARGFEAPQA